jgi:peptidoglycan/LPS O-acetylase OafA/YrhL
MQRTPRFAHIDVLRAVAALLVIYQHAAEEVLRRAGGIAMTPLERALIVFGTQTVGFGEIGVCVFLMISGFVVPASLQSYRGAPVRTFAAHRFFRLYPAYWLSLALWLVFLAWEQGHVRWDAAAANATMLQAYLGFPNLMGLYWTLELELFFYTACVLLFLAGRLASARTMFGILLAVVLVREGVRHLDQDLSGQAWFTLTYLRYVGYMFFGLLYRKWLLEGDRRARAAAVVMALATFWLFAGKGVTHFGDAEARQRLFNHLLALGMFVFCTAVWRPDFRLGRYLGRISYSLYLFHPIVFYPLLYWWATLPLALRYHPLAYVALAYAGTLAFSALTYRFIEEPANRLAKRRYPAERPQPELHAVVHES